MEASNSVIVINGIALDRYTYDIKFEMTRSRGGKCVLHRMEMTGNT